MKLKIGNFKGPKGDIGPKGPKGSTGETGQRGSRWTSGTAITGTSTIGTIFPSTGIADAQICDYYINPDTGNVYECTVPGAADVAEWIHIGNIKGPTGATGPAGSISDINDQKPTYSEAAELENINSGETVKIAFGKLKKAISVLISHCINKATASILGHVKLSNSAAITTVGEYALDAIEKNASIDGTLANLIAQQNSNLTNLTSLNWRNILAVKSNGTYTVSNINGKTVLLTYGYVYQIRNTMIIPRDIFVTARGGAFITFNNIKIEVISTTEIKLSNFSDSESDYLFRIFVM